MTRWVLSIDAADDLDQLVDFLIEKFPHEAVQTVDLVTDALGILEKHPKIGRPVEQGLRELVISRGKSGYLALYQYDESADLVIVLAVRHQREQGTTEAAPLPPTTCHAGKNPSIDRYRSPVS